MYILLLVLSLFLSSANATTQSNRSALIRLFDQSKDNFKIKGCNKFNLRPTDIFEILKYKTKFNKTCDLEGEVNIKLLVPFPVNLQVKNLDSYKNLLATAKISLGLEQPPRILGELTKAQLKGKDTIYFNAYYSGEVIPGKTIEVKPGSETIKIVIFDKNHSKKLDEFSFKVK